MAHNPKIQSSQTTSAITDTDSEERARNDVRRAGVEPALHEAGGLQPLGHTNAQPTHFPWGSHCDPQVLGSDFLKLFGQQR